MIPVFVVSAFALGPRIGGYPGLLPPHTARVPTTKPSYMMNQSTIIMRKYRPPLRAHDLPLRSHPSLAPAACNNSGYTDPKTTMGWSIIDFDWSNRVCCAPLPPRT